MARSLHVRLDDAAVAALDVIRAGGLSDSEAVRTALREEVRDVAADESDRAEMRRIREQMTALAPALPD